jgi:hypothetical protein
MGVHSVLCADGARILTSFSMDFAGRGKHRVLTANLPAKHRVSQFAGIGVHLVARQRKEKEEKPR